MTLELNSSRIVEHSQKTIDFFSFELLSSSLIIYDFPKQCCGTMENLFVKITTAGNTFRIKLLTEAAGNQHPKLLRPFT